MTREDIIAILLTFFLLFISAVVLLAIFLPTLIVVGLAIAGMLAATVFGIALF